MGPGDVEPGDWLVMNLITLPTELKPVSTAGLGLVK